MAVLVIADVCGQTAQGYDGMLAVLEPLLEAAPGFIAHGAGVDSLAFTKDGATLISGGRDGSMRRWHADGTLATMQARLLGLAEERGLIRWHYGAVDGSFSPWHRRR